MVCRCVRPLASSFASAQSGSMGVLPVIHFLTVAGLNLSLTSLRRNAIIEGGVSISIRVTCQ